MLVLTREIGTSIRIADNIEVIVLSHHHGHVKLGINAPKEIEVHREEVYERIKKERLEKETLASTQPKS